MISSRVDYIHEATQQKALAQREYVSGAIVETHIVRKYAFETHMKFEPPLKSRTIDGMTVDVTVASRDVRRLTRDRTMMMTQNLGPFSNLGLSSPTVVSSTEASPDPGVEAVGS